MVRGPMLTFEAPGAKIIGLALEPRKEVWDEAGHWRKYTVTGAMPPDRTPVGPAAVLSEAGRGRILYFAGEWFASYKAEGNPAVRKTLAGLVASLLPDRMLSVSKPLRVEVSLMRSNSGYVVSLVKSAIQKQSGQHVHAEEIPPAENISIDVRVPERPLECWLMPERKRLNFTWSQERVKVTVPRLDIHAAVLVQTR
jgi:hypothetical protein